MNCRRCPWCGKIVNYANDRRMINKRRTPRYLRFARCQQCGCYYGQNVYSKRLLISTGLILVVIVIMCIFQFVPPIFPWVIVPGFLAFALSLPLCRMDENEEMVTVEKSLFFEGVLIEGTLKRQRYYFLIPRFDVYESFTVVSPVCIIAQHKKNNAVKGYFLYEHTENKTMLNQHSILYDSKGKVVATIKISNAASNS